MAELKVHGVGIATADPEFKRIGEKNTPVCNVNLAFNRSFKKGDEWEKETAYMRAQVFGNRAERMAETVKKGSPVFVDGYVSQNNWTNDKGEKRSTLVLSIRDFQVCEKFSKKTSPTENQENVPVNASTGSNDDIPF